MKREAIRKARLPDPTERVWTHQEKKEDPEAYKKFRAEQKVSAEKRVAAIK